MWWECSECGCRVRRQRQPERCPECGIAGNIFPDTLMDSGWEPGGGTMREYWLECGLAARPSVGWERQLSPSSQG